ncbi:NFX1-type zinc finger-containing protein 1-like [Penaeus indicus]|uniref:NFX1-type zinc finger-containing protein 1-like n=1 Tax=Penaeus indicus TaxID=29960 RepID=UPI00300CDE55
MSWRARESEDHSGPRGRGFVPPWRQKGRDDNRYFLMRSRSQEGWGIETDSFSRRGRGSDYNKREARSRDNLCDDSLPKKRRAPRKERQYPIGRKQLELLLDQHPDLVVLELLREQSGYQLYLQQDIVCNDSLILLIRVLARACSAKSNKQNLFELFCMTCEQKFMDRLCAFSMTIKRQYPSEASTYFLNLHIFLETFATAMTTNAIDRIADLTDTCISALGILQDQGFVEAEVKEKYEELQKMLSEAREKWTHKKSQASTHKGKYMMDDMEPPDDFRELPVHPVAYDLSKQQRPFLRRNIVEGKYKDGQHYLDIQFRLLREDFVRPLRNGINDFRDDTKNIREVRIYRNVFIVESDIKRKCLIHYIQLNLPKHLKVENSKRLLYGNLLCFSQDNFRSMVLASVAERDVDMAKKGMIGVKFESDIQDFDMSGKFTVAESRAYFMAYKHVLQTLQDMSGNPVPMEEYIVHVNHDVKIPTYLDMEDRSYDLRVVRDITMMKKSEIKNKLECLLHKNYSDSKEESISEKDSDNSLEELRSVPMCHGLEAWPSSLDMGLDTSQHKALHGALTRQFAIIQGPPGTGKTFIGLKITQTLLHNSQFWKNEEDPTPILVVCYTNHALDQFLEGMMSYTKSIVRVGSRSKNEALSNYQINYLARSVRLSRGIPDAIFGWSSQLYDNVVEMEYKIKHLRVIAKTCVALEGILTLESFLQEDIIPKHLQSQLMASSNQMTKWLLLNMQQDDLRNASFEEVPQPYEGYPAAREVAGPQENDMQENDDGLDKDQDDYFQDAEELIQLEEEDRRLDDLDDIPMTDQRMTVRYEITYQMLDRSMEELSNRETDLEEYFRHAIYKSQKECLMRGLNLPESHAEMEKLESLDINIWRLDFLTRWRLYKFWLLKLYQKVMKKLTVLEATFQRKAIALQEVKNQEFLHIMRHHSIVGMTTTGAAQYSAVMQDLAPAIVIIEEAAEILESHVITALTSKCQHLILIGDHQQLRPSATVYELATKYGLETSLFERMIKNGLA